MKTLTIILIALVMFSCKKDEPKSITIYNGIDQSIHSDYDSPNLIETVVLVYVGADGKQVRIDKFPVSYSSVRDVDNYTVTSTPLPDNITGVIVLVDFHYKGSNMSVISYQSNNISIGEGMNSFTITENDRYL